MLEGVAVGGPRHAVKLTASAEWDGRVKQPESMSPGALTRYYPGRYKWSHEGNAWMWHEDRVTPKPTRVVPPRLDNPKKTDWPW